jgi:hypothetical protein
MNEYVTLEQFKQYRGIPLITDDDNELLRSLIERASRLWDRLTGKRFYPRVETRYFDHPDEEDDVLRMDDDLLEATTLTTNNGSTSISSSHFWPMTGRSYSATPYQKIVLNRGSTSTYFTYTTTPQHANSVAGVWGYHSDYGNAWHSSGDTLSAALSDTTSTTVTVASAGGADYQGRRPRFEEMALLRVDSEFLYVVSRSRVAETLTVLRGVNGSTAATHTLGTAIYRYEFESAATAAAVRLAAWLYVQKDSQQFDRVAFAEMGAVEIPVGLPADVKTLLSRFTVKGASV